MGERDFRATQTPPRPHEEDPEHVRCIRIHQYANFQRMRTNVHPHPFDTAWNADGNGRTRRELFLQHIHEEFVRHFHAAIQLQEQIQQRIFVPGTLSPRINIMEMTHVFGRAPYEARAVRNFHRQLVNVMNKKNLVDVKRCHYVNRILVRQGFLPFWGFFLMVNNFSKEGSQAINRELESKVPMWLYELNTEQANLGRSTLLPHEEIRRWLQRDGVWDPVHAEQDTTTRYNQRMRTWRDAGANPDPPPRTPVDLPVGDEFEDGELEFRCYRSIAGPREGVPDKPNRQGDIGAKANIKEPKKKPPQEKQLERARRCGSRLRNGLHLLRVGRMRRAVAKMRQVPGPSTRVTRSQAQRAKRKQQEKGKSNQDQSPMKALRLRGERSGTPEEESSPQEDNLSHIKSPSVPTPAGALDVEGKRDSGERDSNGKSPAEQGIEGQVPAPELPTPSAEMENSVTKPQEQERETLERKSGESSTTTSTGPLVIAETPEEIEEIAETPTGLIKMKSPPRERLGKDLKDYFFTELPGVKEASLSLMNNIQAEDLRGLAEADAEDAEPKEDDGSPLRARAMDPEATLTVVRRTISAILQAAPGSQQFGIPPLSLTRFQEMRERHARSVQAVLNQQLLRNQTRVNEIYSSDPAADQGTNRPGPITSAEQRAADLEKEKSAWETERASLVQDREAERAARNKEREAFEAERKSLLEEMENLRQQRDFMAQENATLMTVLQGERNEHQEDLRSLRHTHSKIHAGPLRHPSGRNGEQAAAAGE